MMILAKFEVAETEIDANWDLDIDNQLECCLSIPNDRATLKAAILTKAVEEALHTVESLFIVTDCLRVLLLFGLCVAILLLNVRNLELLLAG